VREILFFRQNIAMSGDSMIYDMSQMTEGSPQVFVKRDWLNLQDQNNGNYLGNQMVLDTSQLANSNKYMAYREAYFAVPLLLTATNAAANGLMIDPSVAASSPDQAFGLKSWFGSIIHSLSLDYAGTTIIQTTSLCSMWQQFGLLTTMSLQDVKTNGASIGFFPDTSDSWSYLNGDSPEGPGVTNNCNSVHQEQLAGIFGTGALGNAGQAERQKILAFDLKGIPGSRAGGAAYSVLLEQSTANQLRIGTVFNTTTSSWQCQQMAIIRLKDIHPFFQQVPLLKGVFMRLTLNLNQPSITLTKPAGTNNLVLTSTVNPLGGVNPLFVAASGLRGTSMLGQAIDYQQAVTPSAATPTWTEPNSGIFAVPGASGVFVNSPVNDSVMTLSLSVGSRCNNATQAQIGTPAVIDGAIGNSIFLYVPAYTFNPTFEEAYLASPTKTIVYTDIYQFQTAETGTESYNFLITNGIANIKSVCVIPYFSVIANEASQAATQAAPYQSPFDPAGCGPTSPLTHQSNFNVVVAGQNMIYNTQQYTFEQYMNQLSGCNSVNANLVDGLTSGLISQYDFSQSYCYYYVNTSRMLPVDEAVPKSVTVQGTNRSTRKLKFVVFIEYGVQVSVDVLTGARV